MTRRTDFLIIGGGIAGTRAAVALADVGDVVLLTKTDPAESNTGYAQGGIAAAVGPDDSPDLHFADTVAAGDGLCVDEAVRVLVEDGVRYTRELMAWGAQFDRDASGEVSLGREGAHSVRRVLHAADATGREIGRALWHHVSRLGRVEALNHVRAVELIVEEGRCVGVRSNGGGEVRARAVLLATGGAGQVFRETTNPPIATGDGVALAWRAGARVTDMEFVQFHPTALSVPGAPRVLLTEALRGEGARLLNVDGDAFMTRYEAAGDLASRDLVSRAMVTEMTRTGAPVYLSLRHVNGVDVEGHFPTAAAACRNVGLNLAHDLIPVSPAAHYVMGGVETDLWGRTTVPGLYAAGEVACTGVHGANRLASNSLLEGLVFGARAAQVMPQAAASGALPVKVGEVTAVRSGSPSSADLAPTADAVRELMWQSVGLSRERGALEAAVQTLDAWQRAVGVAGADTSDDAWRLLSLVTVGGLMARAALRRDESRGGHFRADHPTRDDVHWRIHVGERLPR